MNNLSRRAQLLRLELTDQILLYLDDGLDEDALVDWALDHPFFEDRSELSPEDERVIGAALGRILTIGAQEPIEQRTTREQLAEAARALQVMAV